MAEQRKNDQTPVTTDAATAAAQAAEAAAQAAQAAQAAAAAAEAAAARTPQATDSAPSPAQTTPAAAATTSATPDATASAADPISEETGQFDARFILWREFCADYGIPVETLPSQLSGAAREEWGKIKDSNLHKPENKKEGV